MHKSDRERKIQGRGGSGKTMVVGAIERGGGIRLKVEKSNDRKTLHTFIKASLDGATECIMTDELPSYNGIDDSDTRHETVSHHTGEYVRGDCHTNNIECVWSLFKRSIVGAYHQVSTKHLDAYLDEFEFRFSNRENPYMFRDSLLKLIASPNLEYKELIKEAY